MSVEDQKPEDQKPGEELEGNSLLDSLYNAAVEEEPELSEDHQFEVGSSLGTLLDKSREGEETPEEKT